MTNLEMATKNYSRGLWTDGMIGNLVRKGKLTAAEYAEITGSEYTGETTTVQTSELDAAYQEGVNQA